MPYAYIQDSDFRTVGMLQNVPAGVESVEFQRGGLPATPEALTIVGGAIEVDPVKVESLNTLAEEAWVAEELAGADVVVNMKADGHSRGSAGNLAQWRQYRNDLRNHVIGGVVQGERPSKPS